LKRIAKFIAVIILITTLFALPACSSPDGGKNNGKPENNADTSESGQLEETAEAIPESFIPNLPDMDYDGYEFRALVCTNNVYGFYTFDVEGQNGDILDDAIYTRNRYIEEKYNVVLKETAIEDFMQLSPRFKRSVTSGSDDFDICLQIDRYGYDLAVEGYALSADKLPYMDLTRPWYRHDLNDTFSVGNKHFIAYSDECLHIYEGSMIMSFNKRLVSDLGIESPYNLVKNNAWTYDKFFDLCRSAVYDIDGDGIMTDADLYGVVCQDDQLLANFWICAGYQTVVKDPDGMLALNTANENFYNILEKARENLFGGIKLYFDARNDKVDNFKPRNAQDGVRDISLQQFENNLALFHATSIGRIPHMRAMETDFGIVPFPKADGKQARYYTRVSGGWFKMVPSHTLDPERTSIILEAVAAESRKTVLPAFKDINLRTKLARDDESAEMLDIIFDNIVADLGDMMFLDSIGSLFTMEIRGQGNFASLIEKNEAGFQKVLDKVNEAASNLD